MKAILIAVALFFTVMAGNAQNLVPNPSFEDYTNCPTATDQLGLAVGWTSYRASPDYFNTCANLPVGIPLNAWGEQSPYHGNAYAFLGTYDGMSSISNREYIGCKLLQPLDSGIEYYVTAFVSRADFYLANGASNNLGFQFFNQSYSISNPAPINNYSHIHSYGIITDSVNWTRISGSFVADSNYEYLSIGNFYDDQHTDTLDINNNAAGYYLDAICVSTDSLTCDLSSRINSVMSDRVQIYPNPCNDILNIRMDKPRTAMSLYDNLGRPLLRIHAPAPDTQIDVSSFPAGTYMVELISEKYLSIQKVILLK